MLLIRLFLIFAFLLPASTHAATDVEKDVPDSAAGISRSNKNVDVPHTASDLQISRRLQRILEATGWFTNPKVESREGLVTLKGQVTQKAQREWAESLARDTNGVVAVINSIEVPAGQWFDLRPAEQETRGLIKRFLGFTPYLLASILVLAVVAGCAIVAIHLGRRTAQKRMKNPLMIEIVAKLFALPVILIGIYLVLRISGLTGMAVTILGGTGALGLVAGFAMKNILENYFSGVMLSISNPYTVGDIITVNGKTGVVRKLTTRGTVLVDFDGNHIIIPNSTIYGTTVVNETANPSVRVKFSIKISIDESPSKVRKLILDALHETAGVLEKPEALVLLSSLDAGVIAYDVYFWIDTQKSSGIKMKSLAMEAIRTKLCQAKIPLSATTREVMLIKDFENDSFDDSKKPIFNEAPSTAETSIESHSLLKEANRGREIDHGSRLL